LLLTLLIAGAFAGAEPLPVLAPVPADTHAEVYRAPGQLHVFLSGATPGLLDLRRTSDRAADEGQDAPTCNAQGIDLFAYELATEAWIPAVCAALESSPPEIPIGPVCPQAPMSIRPSPGRPRGRGSRSILRSSTRTDTSGRRCGHGVRSTRSS